MAGKNKGKEGKVLKTFSEESKVIVEGVNIVKRHIPKRGETPGQIVESERAIHVSTVQVLDPSTKQPSRIGFRMEDGKKVRIAKKSGKAI